MENITIENNGNEMILKINRKGFHEDYIISLLKRLQIEELAHKADFNKKILDFAEEINQEWWNKNGEKFLKNIKK